MGIDRASIRNAFVLLAGIALLVGISPAAYADDTFVVTSTADPGNNDCATEGCTLREAITAANNDTDHDTINFDIAAAGPNTIAPTSALPTITQPLTINGASEPDYDGGNPVIVIDGDSAGDVDGFAINAAGTTIKGLTIKGFDGTGGGGRAGIRISANNAVIQDNYIGLNAAGNGAAGNWFGISSSAASATIGGPSGEGNVISANSTNVHITGDTADGNTIQGNIVGLTADGNTPLSSFTGILLNQSDDNLIGGTGPGDGNVITFNDVMSGQGTGLSLFQGANNNDVFGNFIGTNFDGTADPGGANPVGISVANNAQNNQIGGETLSHRNLISGNRVGIELGASFSGGATGNDVLGNYIGTDVTGEEPVPNTEHGIAVYNPDNEIGSPTAGNLIAFNAMIGVVVSSALPGTTGNRISGNSIHSNGGLGIDLSDPAGPTPNDEDDPDTGPNNLQNFPVIDSIRPSIESVTIEGTFNSTPGEDFILEFFTSPEKDPSNFGEGARYLGGISQPTDLDGNATFEVDFLEKIPAGHFVTATATGPSGTSEFSRAKRFCTKLGTAGSDTLTGTPGRDVLCGMGGSDTLEGLGKSDALLGGRGGDVLRGGRGADLLLGQGGKELLLGGKGDDDIFGNAGRDVASYKDSRAPVVVDLAAGTASGRGSDDLVSIESAFGSRRGDTLKGASGGNVLKGREGNDKLRGREGNDKLLGEEGNDNFKGGPGTDICKQGPGSGFRRSCEKP